MKQLLWLALASIATANVATAADWKPAGDKIKTRWAAKVTPENAWREYPRPQMVRKDWQNLNGLWQYAVRKRPDGGEQDRPPETWDGTILVPFCIESSLSGVGRILLETEELWYRRDVEVEKKENRVLLHFDAVDYECEAWVNGKSVGRHKGGNTPFTFDITEAAADGKNEVLLKVLDATDRYQLRGKQTRNPKGIWYTRVSGIWQTVWLETVPQTYIQRIAINTGINPGTIRIATTVGGDAAQVTNVRVTASFKGKDVGSADGTLEQTSLTVEDAQLWSPDAPNLYDLKVELLAGDKKLDSVESYAGIRTVGKKQDGNGHWRFTLNDKEIFHLGPLDQGWWPDGLLTPPSDEALRFDIDYLKAAGFNAIRSHIKVRPRRYYAYCDKVGMMMWQDQVSGSPNAPWTRMKPDPKDVEWEDFAHKQFMFELKEMMDTLHNNPCIVMWVPFNESWGQHKTMEVGQWTVAYDPSRLVNIASGGNFWPVGHIADHHSYPHPGFPIQDPRFDDYVKVVGEFGGHGFVVDPKHLWNPGAKNWGYGGLPKDKAELMERYRKSIEILTSLKRSGVAGGIYTQTTDVENEVNGLMTYDREVQKFAQEELKLIHERLYAARPPGKPALPVAERNNVPVRYTTTKPADDWAKPDFDDSAWKEGPAGLGTHGTKNANVKTVWDTKEVWVRTNFEYDPDKGRLMLNIFWDEDPTIYINGVQAAKLEGFTTEHRLVDISDEAQAALKKGKNTLSFHCRNAVGGQYIDVSLLYTEAEK